jgi:class 3 adenylate cyclase
MIMALVTFLTALYYFIPSLYELKYYRLPAMFAGTLCCYTQARVLVWYDSGLYFYAFAFVIAATIVLRLSLAQSLLFAALMVVAQWPSFVEAGIGVPLLASAVASTFVFIMFARSGYATELNFFRANHENLESQRQIIELNIEFSDRIRAFLPREISSRLFRYVEERHMTILQAVEEVLRPRHRQISCLFSDIRGFTRSTLGKGDSFLDEGVIPNVKECTYVVEHHGGIPRKIGDLLFAYFDRLDPRDNLLRCFSASLEMIRVNNEFNKVRSENDAINRYVLMASGEAIVGNLGGFDSSIEITALGNPVNLLSRMDEATKNPAIRTRITNNHIVMDERTATILKELVPSLMFDCLELKAFGVRIRDFESIDRIFLHRVDTLNVHASSQLEDLVNLDVTDAIRAEGTVSAIRARPGSPRNLLPY